MKLEVRCSCVWHGVSCDKDATQEDGLCDWCGSRRHEDMAGNEFYDERWGLAGGAVTGYNHQIGWPGIPDNVRPTACWMEPDSPDSARSRVTTGRGAGGE